MPIAALLQEEEGRSGMYIMAVPAGAQSNKVGFIFYLQIMLRNRTDPEKVLRCLLAYSNEWLMCAHIPPQMCQRNA